MQVTFHGVRGSTPAIGADTRRYGGNTACVEVAADGCPPIVIDLGTGIRRYGQTIDGAFNGVLLLTHLHWDHIQGLPFFGPVMAPGATARLIGPPQPEVGSLVAALHQVVKPPFFPVPLDQLCAGVTIEELDRDTIQIGEASITAARVDHPGSTNAYRIDHRGTSLAYVSDHQESADGSVTDELLALIDGVDLLIHDAQYTRAEFAAKSDWGHSTFDHAVAVAQMASARRLALFHHDPARDDDGVDELLVAARELAGLGGPEVFAAAEGLTAVVAQPTVAANLPS